MVASGIGLGACGLAEHVVGIGVAALFHLPCAFLRFVDIPSEYELAAEFAHGTADGGADHGFAKPSDGTAYDPRHALFLFVVQEPAREQQRPGRGIDQRRTGMAEVTPPVGGCDLVLDQRVDRVGIGHAQQRFGKAHERHAFPGRQAIFGKHDLHQSWLRVSPDHPHEFRRMRGNRLAIGARQVRELHQPPQHRPFIAELIPTHGLANPVQHGSHSLLGGTHGAAVGLSAAHTPA